MSIAATDRLLVDSLSTYFLTTRTMASTIRRIRPIPMIQPKIHIQHPPIGIMRLISSTFERRSVSGLSPR
jgi:hypothetical protein